MAEQIRVRLAHYRGGEPWIEHPARDEQRGAMAEQIRARLARYRGGESWIERPPNPSSGPAQ